MLKKISASFIALALSSVPESSAISLERQTEVTEDNFDLYSVSSEEHAYDPIAEIRAKQKEHEQCCVMKYCRKQNCANVRSCFFSSRSVTKTGKSVI